jgi:hypothetical protein
MAGSIFDWILRTAMLVFAGLVTLSMLGAIAAIPSGSSGGFFTERLSPFPQPAPQQPEPQLRRGTEERAAPLPSSSEGATMISEAAQSAPAAREDWLETIAYALLALAGLFAIALLLLARAVGELRRISGSRQP